ncbi:uncharacterized protein LOC110744741 isoform X1 [Prunus avium]|uniref:Uncharacterized protein LOC110744741 isoform X1 n=1 Tax=Prunus avium TaxID=42229 RepID=A0A6P5REZ3_PRUAV|nr:uncharacterized protein LOC110744741 isoform X1 [Prunus avium]
MDPDSNLPPANMRIIVSWRGAISTLEIPVATRIIEVKLLIWEALHVPVPADRQELSWEGQFLKDELTLQNYHIPPNASLTVFNKIEVKIYLEYSRFHFVYVVYDGTTVGELKAKLHADQGIDIEHKVLRMNGFDLDDRALLWAARVIEGTKLHLVEYRSRR